jgi:hypothetical protein
MPSDDKTRTLSYECREQMEVWLRVHCPCAFDNPECEFYLGLLAICQEEVDRAIAQERGRAVQDITRPRDQ